MRSPLRAQGLLAVCLMTLASVGCGDFSGSSSGGADVEPDAFFDLSAAAGGVEAFTSSVYPIVQENCVDCHAGSGPGSPHFAHPDPDTAYQALVRQGKVDLGSPELSRIAVKVSQAHHCWTDCASDAALLAAAVQAWADEVEYGEGGVAVEGALASTSLAMGDGILDTGSERYNGNLIALYEFKEGFGTTAFDTSGVAPALNLEFRGNVEWMSSWGVVLDGGRLAGAPVESAKLYDQIADPVAGTQQFTIEAWVTPANIVQEGPARIVSYSRNQVSRNVTLGQVQYNYNARTRSLAATLENPVNGTPALQTADADQDAQDRLQHVVLTYDQFRGRRIFVDGEYTGDPDEQGPGRLWNWSEDDSLMLGAEVGGSRSWLGQIRMVALYRQSLTDAQIRQNFEAGVGQRRLLRFDVTQWMGVPSSVDMVVSEFDDYSYLLCQPTLRTTEPNGTQVANLRIAVNGELSPTGQGFQLVDRSASSTKQELSRQCSIIPQAQGRDLDQFTLVFEHLGGYQNVVVEGEVPPLGIPLDPSAVPQNGIRDFDRIDASFARLTEQDRTVGAATFEAAIEQLPPSYDVRSFVSANQMAIAKLALDYCEALVDRSERSLFFPDFDFRVPPEEALDVAGRAALYTPLYDRLLSDGLLNQPARADVERELDTLVDQLMATCVNPGDCGGLRTRAIAKSACTAVLASAAVTLH